MPFQSKRQQRAAFGGHIPGFSKSKAKEWADKTNFSKIPDRAPAEKGKETLLTKKRKGKLKKASANLRGANNIIQRLRAAGYTKSADKLTRELARDAKIDPVAVSIMQGPAALKRQREKEKSSADALVSLCTKLAVSLSSLSTANIGTAVKSPGSSVSKTMSNKAQRVGRYKGVSTNNSLKPPGRALSKQIVNPRRNIRDAMTAFAK